jgi:hypothetical protein
LVCHAHTGSVAHSPPHAPLIGARLLLPLQRRRPMSCNARSTAYTMQRTSHERVQRNEVVEYDVPKVDRPVAAQLSSASCSTQYTARNIQRATCNRQHATYSMQHTACNMQHAAFKMQDAAMQGAAMQHATETCSANEAWTEQPTPQVQRTTCDMQRAVARARPRPAPSTQHDSGGRCGKESGANPSNSTTGSSIQVVSEAARSSAAYIQSGHREVGHGLSGNAAVAASEWLSAVIPLSKSSRPQ